MRVENDAVILHLDKKYGLFVKSKLEEITRLLAEYFGKEMTVILKDTEENKPNVLDEYVKEAESLFNL